MAEEQFFCRSKSCSRVTRGLYALRRLSELRYDRWESIALGLPKRRCREWMGERFAGAKVGGRGSRVTRGLYGLRRLSELRSGMGRNQSP